jgi:hypothetical protein
LGRWANEELQVRYIVCRNGVAVGFAKAIIIDVEPYFVPFVLEYVCQRFRKYIYVKTRFVSIEIAIEISAELEKESIEYDKEWQNVRECMLVGMEVTDSMSDARKYFRFKNRLSRMI